MQVLGDVSPFCGICIKTEFLTTDYDPKFVHRALVSWLACLCGYFPFLMWLSHGLNRWWQSSCTWCQWFWVVPVDICVIARVVFVVIWDIGVF